MKKSRIEEELRLIIRLIREVEGKDLNTLRYLDILVGRYIALFDLYVEVYMNIDKELFDIGKQLRLKYIEIRNEVFKK